MTVFLIKSALVLFGIVGSLASLHPRVKSCSFLHSVPAAWMVGIYYGGRILILTLAILKFHFIYPGFNVFSYLTMGEDVLAGQLPDRDFYHPYLPLFPYLVAAFVMVWHSPLMIMLMFQLLEFAGMSLLISDVGPRVGKPAFLLYALNPVTLIYLWLGAQQAASGMLIFAVAMHFRSSRASGLVSAVALMASKVFSFWFILPLLLARGWSARIYFVGLCAVIVTPFLILGSSVVSFSQVGKHPTEMALSATAGSIWEIIPASPVASKLVLMAALGAMGTVITLRYFTLCGTGSMPGEDNIEWFVGISALCLILTFQVFSRYIAADYLPPATWIVPLLLIRGLLDSSDYLVFLVGSGLQCGCELLMYHQADYTSHFEWIKFVFATARIVTPLITGLYLMRCIALLIRWRPDLRPLTTSAE